MVDQVQFNLVWYVIWMLKFKGEFEVFNLEILWYQIELDDLFLIKVEKGIFVIDKGCIKDLELVSGKGKCYGDVVIFLVMVV